MYETSNIIYLKPKLWSSNEESLTCAFLFQTPVFSIIESSLEHCAGKLCQLDFHPFWNFMNVVLSNNNDIETGILSNSSLRG